MINELFRKMTVAQIFSALSGTVCMLVDSIIIGRLLGVDSMSAYGLALPILTLLILCACRGDCHSGMFLTPHHLAVFRGKRSDLQHRAFRLSSVYA